jgi:hypothetical protein
MKTKLLAMVFIPTLRHCTKNTNESGLQVNSCRRRNQIIYNQFLELCRD